MRSVEVRMVSANEDLGSSACVVMMFLLIEECGRYKYCKCQFDSVEIRRKRRVRMKVKTSSMAWRREANLLTASTKAAIVELVQARLRRLTTKECTQLGQQMAKSVGLFSCSRSKKRSRCRQDSGERKVGDQKIERCGDAGCPGV